MLVQLPRLQYFDFETAESLEAFSIPVSRSEEGHYYLQDEDACLTWPVASALAQEFGYYIQSESYGLWVYRERWYKWGWADWGASQMGWVAQTPYRGLPPVWFLVEEPEPSTMPVPFKASGVLERTPLWDMVR